MALERIDRALPHLVALGNPAEAKRRAQRLSRALRRVSRIAEPDETPSAIAAQRRPTPEWGILIPNNSTNAA
jgi:hypothetical protein